MLNPDCFTKFHNTPERTNILRQCYDEPRKTGITFGREEHHWTIIMMIVIGKSGCGPLDGRDFTCCNIASTYMLILASILLIYGLQQSQYDLS